MHSTDTAHHCIILHHCPIHCPRHHSSWPVTLPELYNEADLSWWGEQPAEVSWYHPHHHQGRGALWSDREDVHLWSFTGTILNWFTEVSCAVGIAHSYRHTVVSGGHQIFYGVGLCDQQNITQAEWWINIPSMFSIHLEEPYPSFKDCPYNPWQEFATGQLFEL